MKFQGKNKLKSQNTEENKVPRMQIRRTMLSQNSDIRINRHKTMKIQNYENMSRESDTIKNDRLSRFEKQTNNF